MNLQKIGEKRNKLLMIQFDQLRKKGGIHRHATVVELGFWDLLKLMFGREIEFWPMGEMVILRSAPAYDAFNLEAPRADAPKV